MPHFKKLFTVFLIFGFIYAKPFCQSFNLVKDINQTKVFNDGGGVFDFIKLNNLVFFTGWTPETGYELWISDGTAVGTRMIKDLHPGTTSSYPHRFTRVGNDVYFTARSTWLGTEELFKSDGTEAGTQPIKSFRYFTPEGYFGTNMVSLNNELYFTYNDSTHGMELWKTNGTEAGTVLVKDIEPGHKSSQISDLVAMNGMLYFKRVDNVKSGIWKSDGTANGTIEIINQYNIQYQTPFNVSNTILNGFLYYIIQNNEGTGIWKTDGTTAGTVQVKKLDNGNAWVEIMAVANNKLLFTVRNSTGIKSLWKTDGTESGTTEIININVAEIMYGQQRSFTVIGSMVYFTAITASSGAELWKTDGTAIGTEMVKDIHPGSESSQPRNFVTVSGKFIFTANDGVHGNELWISDGTFTGTSLLQDYWPGVESSNPFYVGTETQQLIFSIYVNNGQSQLWKTDGTISGTELIRDLRIGTASSIRIYFSAINAYDQFLLFEANNGINGVELWRTDGTEAGTFMLPELIPGNNDVQTYISHFTKLNGKILFRAIGPYPKDELWITDGTAGGTQKIKNNFIVGRLVEVNSIAYFADASAEGIELWKTDGTIAGTSLVKDIWPEPYQSSQPQYLTNVNGTVFFAAFDSAYKNNLWKSDGTEAGTKRVKKINQTDNIDITGIRQGNESEFVSVNGTLFFTADDGLHGMELWKSDGTESGTFMVKDILAGQNSTTTFNTDTLPKHLTNVNGTLFFVAYDAVNGHSLWKSDGTESGTVILKSFGNINSYNAYNLTAVNDLLMFSRHNGINGIELWKSDGTANGTVMIKDIALGQHSGFQSMGIVADGVLYFTANDNIHGDEIWKSDGTEAGTVMVQNISSNGGCNPQVFAKVGNKLFAVVTTDNYGKEIWVAQDGITTNLPDLNSIGAVSVFPNPANDYTTIVFPALTATSTWQFYNSNGQLIQTGSLRPGATRFSINMVSISKGIYLVKIKSPQSTTVVKKIIKQ